MWTSSELVELILAGAGGFTYDVLADNMIDTGLAVSERPDATERIAASCDDLAGETLVDVLANGLDNYLVDHAGDWSEGYSFGAWLADDGYLWLDLVTRYERRDLAVEAGRNANQVAIFDLDNGTEIPTGGTGS